jgi:DNA-binding beta-propeller fold protein YncE
MYFPCAFSWCVLQKNRRNAVYDLLMVIKFIITVIAKMCNLMSSGDKTFCHLIRRRNPMLKIFIVLAPLMLWLCSTTLQAAPEFVRESKTIFAHPHDVELHPSGQWLFVADTNNHNIKVLGAQSLELIAILGEGELDGPHDIHFDAEGRLLVADSGNDRVLIYRLNKLQTALETVLSKNMSSPEGVTSSPDGHIYVASTGNHKVLQFYQNDLIREVGGRGDGKLEFVRPHDIELGPDGFVYVADPGNRRIQVLTDSLTYHSTVYGKDQPYREPKYLALDKGNYLYIADQQNNVLRIYDDERIQVESVTMAGKRPLNYIEGVEVSGQQIWISDTYNNRIVLFKWPH